MSLALKGTLTNPLGQPIKNAKIEMRALKTSSVVVATSTAVAVTSDTGEYTLTIEPGTYVIRVMFSGAHSWNTICKRVTVDSATLATNLNELVLTANLTEDASSSSSTTVDQLILTLKSMQENINKTLAEVNQTAEKFETIRSDAATALSTANANSKTIEALNTDMRKAVEDANKASSEAKEVSKQASDSVASVNTQMAEIRDIDTRVSSTSRQLTDQYNSFTPKADAAIAAGTTASNAATRANLWAEAPFDQIVENGGYSAKHWAEVAKQNAASAGGSSSGGNFSYLGKWDFTDDKLPTGYETVNGFWQVTRNVTVDGTAYVTGDILYHAVDNGIGRFFKASSQGGSGSSDGGAVKSVAGKTGEVILFAADVGLDKVRNVEMYSKTEADAAFPAKADFIETQSKANNAVSHDELGTVTSKLSNVAWDGAITSTTGYLGFNRLSGVPDWILKTHEDGDMVYFQSPDGTQFRLGQGAFDVFNNKGANTLSIAADGHMVVGTIPESQITGVLPISKGGTGDGDGKWNAKKLTMVGDAAGMFFDTVGDYGVYPIHVEDGKDPVEGVVIGAASTSLAITSKGGMSFTGPNDSVIWEVDSTGTLTTGKVPYSSLEGVAPAGIVKRLKDGGIMYSSGNGYLTIDYANLSVNKATPTEIKFPLPFHDTEYSVTITKKFGTDIPTAAEFAAEVVSYAFTKTGLKLATDSADDIVVCVKISGEKGVVGQDGTTEQNSTLGTV